MLPKIFSFPQLLMADLHALEAKVSGRFASSRPFRAGRRLGAILALVCFVALQPSKGSSEAAFAFEQWGNGGWTYGSAFNYRTQSEAKIAAMNTCNQSGYNCAIRGNFRKVCFAFAVQDNNNGFATGIHSDPDVANRQALAGCTRMGLKCTIHEEFCDNVSEAEQSARKPHSSGLFEHVAAVVQSLKMFCLGAFIVLFGLFFIGKNVPTFFTKQVFVIAGGPFVLGLAILSLRPDIIPGGLPVAVRLIGWVGLIYAGALSFIAIGAWAHWLLSKDRHRLQLSTFSLIGFSLPATFLCLAAVLNHLGSNQGLDDPLVIGIMFACVLVLGFILADSDATPFIQRAEVSVRSLGTGTYLLLRSGNSTAYKALQSIYESMAAQRDMTNKSNLPAVVSVRPEPLDIPSASSGQLMQLKLKRSQRKGLTGKMFFALDARIEIPAEEYELIRKYQLGNMVIYDSSTRRKHEEALKAHLESTKEHPSYRDSLNSQLLGIGKTFYRFARAGVSATMAGLSLRVTVYSLMKGVHVECKSMGELLAAEKAIATAGENLRAYLDTAATFDGREEVLEF